VAKRPRVDVSDDRETQRRFARVERLQGKVDRTALKSEMGAYDTSRFSGRVKQAAVDRAYARAEQKLDAAKIRAWNQMNRQLAGRTVEAGTPSLLRGLKGWLGGGGSRLTGR
jgi:hypothetical protein